MSGQSSRNPNPRPQRNRTDTQVQINRASNHLATALQSLDLESEEQLAEEITAALRATDRAQKLADER